MQQANPSLKQNRLTHLFYRLIGNDLTDPDDLALHGKIILFHIINLVGISVLLPYGLYRLIHGFITLGIIDLLNAFFLIGLMAYHGITKRFEFPRVSSIILMVALFSYLTMSTGYSNTGLLWSYTLPPICLLQLNRKRAIC